MKSRFLKILVLLILPISLCSVTLDETLNTLSSISNSESVQFRWDPLFRDGVFNFGSHNGSFSVASREGETGFLIIDNRELFNVPMPYNNRGDLVFPEAFVSTLRDTFTRLHENDASGFRIAAIVIDPGHGGKDPGTMGNLSVNGRNTQIYEKDIVLRVGLALRNRLIETYPDKRILMTRDTDVYKTLDQRSEMANSVTVKDNESVIFISIHVNWGANPTARGYEVWHITSGQRRSLLDTSRHNYSPDIAAIINGMLEEEYTSESILLADNILSGFRQTFGSSVPSRGRKANDWFVVRNSRMPAVLVELGFISNREDALLMTGEEGLQRYTSSLYNGITNFIGIFER
ncbi:MAG: N-acetylmuramoyl-L-alanine amidase [Treponema sp.]|jgi:N-acetylmuramoyl-L-alanine amidase|nr:N-acetylmuramoyl-L-alanine amidase [Treponema sp.]